MLPSNSPIQVGNYVCPTCAQPMRTVIQKFGKGVVSGIHVFCDSEGCKYGQNLSFSYSNTMGVVPYVPPEKKITIPENAPKFTLKQERPNGGPDAA